MEKGVQILRSKRTGNFLLNPVGTFRGYGAFVGINPMREIASDAPLDELGARIVELLALSGATGVGFSQLKAHLGETADEETTRIRREYGLDAKGLSTSVLARRFLSAGVEQRAKRKSWRVQRYEYESGTRPATWSGSRVPPVLVPHSAGRQGLGSAVARALSLERP